MLKAAVNAAQPNMGTNTPPPMQQQPMQQQQQPTQQAPNAVQGPMLSKSQYLMANPVGVKPNTVPKWLRWIGGPMGLSNASVDYKAQDKAYQQYAQNYMNNHMQQLNNPQQYGTPQKMGYFAYMSANPGGDYTSYLKQYYQSQLKQQQSAFQQPQQ